MNRAFIVDLDIAIAYIWPMKREFNLTLMREWVEAVGGVSAATAKVMTKTGLAPSTAEKLVRGKYPSMPGHLVRKALAEVTKLSYDDLFPLAPTSRGRAS